MVWLLWGTWDLPRSGIEPSLLHWQVDSLPLSHQESPILAFLKRDSFLLSYPNLFWSNIFTMTLYSSHCSAFMFDSTIYHQPLFFGFPSGSDGKESVCNAGVLGSIPGSGRYLEKEMATFSSILSWKIPWTEEPGGLQSMGSQRVRHTTKWLTLSLEWNSAKSYNIDETWKTLSQVKDVSHKRPNIIGFHL